MENSNEKSIVLLEGLHVIERVTISDSIDKTPNSNVIFYAPSAKRTLCAAIVYFSIEVEYGRMRVLSPHAA